MNLKLKNIIANYIWPILYLVTLIQQKIEPIKVVSANETIKFLKNGGSLSRFGDGELDMVRGGDIYFQPKSKEMTQRLNEILSIDMDKTGKFRVAINSQWNNYKGLNKIQKKYWSIYMPYRRKWFRNLINSKRKGQIYENANYCRWGARIDITNLKKFELAVNEVKEIWENKNVTVIEGDKVRFGVDNNLLDNVKNIRRILGPTRGAWNSYDDILEVAKQYKEDTDIFLIILGPTATIMAYDLYMETNIQSIDIGHLNKIYFETLGKFGYRFPEGNIKSVDEYFSEIVAKIS